MLILNGVVILLHMQKYVLKLGGCHIDRLLLDHFQQIMVILYHEIPAIDVGVEPPEAEAH